MKKLILTAIIGSTIGLNGCSEIPKAPEAKPPVDPPKVELSRLEVNAKASYSFLTEQLNRAIPNQLYWATGQPVDHCPVSECSYQVRVLRNGSVSVGHDSSGRIIVNLPVRTADGRIDAMKRVLGAKIRKHADFTANVTATASLRFTLKPNWSAVPDAQLSFRVHSAEARIGFPGGSVGISVRGKLTDVLNGQRSRLARTIVGALDGKINFKQEAEAAWTQLHSVTQLAEKPPIWLVADPVSLKVENPKGTTDGLRLAIGLDAYLSAHAQSGAPIAPEPEALPSLNVVQNIDGRYKLSLPMRVSVDEINAQLSKLIGKDYQFEGAGKTITAKLIDGKVYTNGPDLVVYAEVRAAKVFLGIFPLKVGAYLNGTPRYDRDATTVYLNQLDYDIDTNNLLLDKAEWFFHGKIRESLQGALRMDVGEDISSARQFLAEKLINMPIGENVVLNGTVDKLEPKSIYTTKGALAVDAVAEGSIRINLR